MGARDDCWEVVADAAQLEEIVGAPAPKALGKVRREPPGAVHVLDARAEIVKALEAREESLEDLAAYYGPSYRDRLCR